MNLKNFKDFTKHSVHNKEQMQRNTPCGTKNKKGQLDLL